MKFAEQRLFIYDRAVFQPVDFEELKRTSTPESFPLSGVEDVFSAMNIAQEFFTNFPRITVKELARTTSGNPQAIDSVYREPVVNSRYQFSRLFKLPAWITFADPEIKHGKTGQTLTQPIDACFTILDLRDANFFPAAGDQLIFNGRLYEVAFAKVKPEEYFQNTMVPMYVHVICGLHQYGDRHPQQVLEGVTVKPGVAPESDVPVSENTVH